MGSACEAAGISTTHFYRTRKQKAETPSAEKAPHGRPRSLTPAEESQVIALLHSQRFMDCAPREVYATLLEEGTYLCSWRTMYRLLARNDEVRERRKVHRHPTYVKPELAAVAPNQVWTWDITYLKAEVRGQFYYLYVAIDLYSRYVTDWLLDTKECASLARRLFERICARENVSPGTLTLHADRGGPMKSKTLK